MGGGEAAANGGDSFGLRVVDGAESIDGVGLLDDLEALSDGIVARAGRVGMGSENLSVEKRPLRIFSHWSVKRRSTFLGGIFRDFGGEVASAGRLAVASHASCQPRGPSEETFSASPRIRRWPPCLAVPSWGENIGQPSCVRA